MTDRKWPTATEIISLMRNGWHLGMDTGFEAHAWLQEGDLGHGGQARDVHKATFWSLRQRGLIRPLPYSFPTQEFVLVEEQHDTNA